MRSTVQRATIFGAIALASLAASAADAATINRREHRQQVRIGQGIASGALTVREAVRLERRAGSIARQEAAMRRSGGRLDAVERHRLDERLDRLSRAIWRQKHDSRRR